MLYVDLNLVYLAELSRDKLRLFFVDGECLVLTKKEAIEKTANKLHNLAKTKAGTILLEE
jgi:hypothetical protein